jgi:hypothetical protein
MCFSVEADVAVGVAVGVVGIDALRHVTRPAQWPLAALPLVFAAHQINEAFVWWGLEGTLSSSIARLAAWIYLGVAFALPSVVPVTVALIEPDRVRRRVMWGFAALGAAVSAVLLVALVRGGPHVHIESLHLAYAVDTGFGVQLAVLYVLATCGAFLASSDRRIALVGLLNLLAVAVLAVLLMTGVISLWCAWAAVVSVLIASYLRSTPPHRAQDVAERTATT